MTRPLVYIAGPYTGPKHNPNDYLAIDRNIARAREAAAELAQANIAFFCPHTHSAHFQAITPSVPPEFWYELDILFLRQATHVLLLEGWASSRGTLREVDLAHELRIPVFESISNLLSCISPKEPQ